MSPVKNSEDRDFCSTNGYVRQDKELKHSDSNKLVVSKKVYIHRNSLLTDMMEVNHFRTLYNMAVAAAFLLYFITVMFYWTEPSRLWSDLNIMKWASDKLSFFVMFWLLFHLFAFAFYEGLKLWIFLRNKMNSKVVDRLFLILYIACLSLTFVVTASYLFEIGLPPISGMATAAEHVRIYMKIHSFIRENIPRGMQYKPQKDGPQQHALYPTRKHYLYYLFAPTLIYRDSYPRSEKRQWGNVFDNFYKFCLCFFIGYCLGSQCFYVFKSTGLQPLTRKEALLVLSGSMVVGTIAMFVIFYTMFHCWQNLFAELLTFDDREFYQDWWNSSSFSQFYRKWNYIVHDWLHAYIYTDFLKLGCSSSISVTLVFLIAAAFHEYIMTVTLGYFCPVLFVIYSATIPHVLLTKGKRTHFWNIFMWFNHFFGTGLFLFVGVSEWYARRNCPQDEKRLNFLPRSWDPSCHIFDFS